MYSAHSDVREAAERLELAVAIRPGFAEAWSDLGDARRVLLDVAGSIAALQRAVRLKPTDAVAQYRLGAEYLRQDKAHLAVEHLQQAYQANPDNQSTLNSLQMALREDGQPEQAAAIKRKLSELLRKRDEVNRIGSKRSSSTTRGLPFRRRAIWPEPWKNIRVARFSTRSAFGVRVNFAVALLRLGHWTEGLTELHDALIQDPGNAELRTALNDALRQAPPG